MVTVEQAIKFLQSFDPKLELLVEGNDGGLPFACSGFTAGIWVDEDSGEESPIAIVGIVN